MIESNELTDAARQELTARLNLIENMLAEGRHTTESWGWTFVLWGLAYYVAIAWSTLGHSTLAWPVTMISASIVTGIGARRQGAKEPETTMGRAIGAIWIAIGSAMFLLLLSAGISGHMDQQTFIAVVAAMLGAANASSGIILKWGAQIACAGMWFVAAVASLFSTVSQSAVIGLVALFFGQIVFGGYMMISEARERKQRARSASGSGAAHA
jgi:hypothetical protein